MKKMYLNCIAVLMVFSMISCSAKESGDTVNKRVPFNDADISGMVLKGRDISPGEFLFAGMADFPEAEAFIVSFILSENRQEIRDVRINLINLNLILNDGSRKIVLAGNDIAKSYFSRHDVINGNIEATNGSDYRLILTLDGEMARGTIEFTYNHNAGSGRTTAVDMGSQPIVCIGGPVE